MDARAIADTRRCLEARRKVALARWEVDVPDWTLGTPLEPTYWSDELLEAWNV